MTQYNTIEDQPVLETRNKSPSTSIKTLVGVSVLASFALGACAATALSYRAAGVTDLAVTENCKTAAIVNAIAGWNDPRAATAEIACSPFVLTAPPSTIGKCPAVPNVPASGWATGTSGGDVSRESFNPERIVIQGAMCGGSEVKAAYGVWSRAEIKFL